MSAMDLVLPFAEGILLSLIFFGGLWMTVRRLGSSRRPVFLMLGSLLVRMSIALVGFLWIANGGWHHAVACLAGFIAGRILTSRIVFACT